VDIHCTAFTARKTGTSAKASARNIQLFILGEKVRLNSRLTCRSGVASHKLAQFSFRHSEFRVDAIQTDNKLREYPHDGLVNVFQSGEMDADLPAELALVN
jgi:hypothetical protein